MQTDEYISGFRHSGQQAPRRSTEHGRVRGHGGGRRRADGRRPNFGGQQLPQRDASQIRYRPGSIVQITCRQVRYWFRIHNPVSMHVQVGMPVSDRYLYRRIHNTVQGTGKQFARVRVLIQHGQLSRTCRNWHRYLMNFFFS